MGLTAQPVCLSAAQHQGPSGRGLGDVFQPPRNSWAFSCLIHTRRSERWQVYKCQNTVSRSSGSLPLKEGNRQEDRPPSLHLRCLWIQVCNEWMATHIPQCRSRFQESTYNFIGYFVRELVSLYVIYRLSHSSILLQTVWPKTVQLKTPLVGPILV